VIIATHEKRIRDLEERKIVLAERIANCGRAPPDFDDALKTSLDFLRDPGICGIHRTRDEGFKTPNVSLPFKVLAGFGGGKSKMVRPRG
jgi:hypothetical protein